MSLTGIILAGGRSTRMGEEKPLVEVNGIRLIEHAIATLEPLCDSLLVSSDNDILRCFGYPLINDVQLNGHHDTRLPNTLNITLPGMRGESIVLEMDRLGICFSSGSACHSGSSEPSLALLAMGLSEEEATVRLVFRWDSGIQKRRLIGSLMHCGM